MKDAAIALLSAIIGFCLSRWQFSCDRTRNGRDVFRLITADMRSKLDELRDSPAVYIEQSIPILRQAVYRVRPFAKDWPGLQAAWNEYESKRQSDTEATAFFLKADELERKQRGGKSTRDMLEDYLNRFDDYVA